MILDVYIAGREIDVFVVERDFNVLTGCEVNVEMSGGGPAGPAGPSGAVTFNKTAALAVQAQSVVSGYGDTGVVPPDLTNPASGHTVLGLTMGAAVISGAVVVQAAGSVLNSSWAWTIGPVFCGAGGALVQTPPDAAWIRQVGVAIAPDQIVIQLGPLILTPS